MNFATRLSLSSALLLAFLMAGCGSKELAAPEKLGPVTAEETEAFADTLVDALLSCHSSKLEKVIDIEAALRRSLRTSTLNANLQHKLFAQYQVGIPALLRSGVACDARSEDPQIRVVRVRELEGKTRILVASSGDDINYWEFAVGKTAQGTLIADDILDISDGLRLSERLRHYNNLVMGDSQNSAAIIEAMTLLQDSPEEGIARFATLSTFAKESMILRSNLLTALSLHDLSAYRDALTSFQRDFPKAPPMPFVEMEAHILAGDPDRALQTLDALDAKLGNPPFLDELRLRVCYEFPSHYGKGLAIAEAALAAEPDRLDAHTDLLNAQILVADHAAAADSMRHIGETYDLIWGPEELADDFFAEYRESPEGMAYLEWLEANFEDSALDEAELAEEAPEAH